MGETLWVVPRDGPEVRALAAAGGLAAVWPLDALTRALAALRRPARRTLDPLGASLAVTVASGEGSLLGAADVERMQGLADAVQEARAGRIRGAALAGIAGRLAGPARERLELLARAVDGYERVLRRRGLADAAGQWDDARAVVAAAAEWPAPLARFDRIVLTLHPPVPPVVLEALVALAGLGERVGRSVTVEVPSTGEATLDAATEPIFAAFEAHPELSPLVVQRAFPPEDGPLSRAVERLGETAAAPAPAAVWSAGKGGAAARRVAQQARAAVQGGASPARCAVVVPDAASGEAVADALGAAGLPVGRRPRQPLSATALGRAGALVARLGVTAFPADEVAWLLASGLVPRLRPLPPPGAAALLERAGVRDDALGGEGRHGAYRLRLEALARREAKGDNAPAARRLLAACEALFAVVRELPARNTLAAHLDGWQRALDALGVWSALEDGALPAGAGSDAACRSLAREVHAREGWRAVMRDVRGTLAALGSPGPELDRGGFAAWLAAAAARHPLPAEPGHPGGVALLLPEEAVERGAFAWVGTVGLADGRFPRPLVRAGAVTDDDRRAINRALGRDAFPLRFGSGEVRPPAALALDGWRLGVALGRAGAASLGFARDDGFREVAGPATFLEAFTRSAGVERVDLPDGPVPELARAGSEAELREAVALAAAGETRDAAARTLAEALDEPWLAEARALGAMEEERVRAFEHPDRPSGRFSGEVTAPDLAQALARRYAFGPDAPLSASTLGRFGRCAFQGFVQTALRVEQPESPGEALDARGQGSFWHLVLEALIPRLREAGCLGRPWREVPSGLVDAAVDEAAETFPERFSTGHPRLFALARERARWMVRRVLDAPHHGLPFEGLVPAEEEVSFGRPLSPEDWREVRLPAAFPDEADICLTGTIDRLDSAPGAVGVLDYKATRRRDAARELLTTDFQLPFYLHAVRARGERRRLQAGWLVLRSGEFQPFESAGDPEVLLATDGPTRARAQAEGRPNLANAVQRLVQKARSGDFGARPEDCAFCPFGAVCRIGDRRKEGGR